MISGDIKKDFPVLKNNWGLVYLDTGASALKPAVVIDKVQEYYKEYGVNIHRGMYGLSERATQEYDQARDAVAHFLNAAPEEVIFTGGTTAGMNMVADMVCQNLKPGDAIVVTRMEHHANLIPWQQQAKKYGCELRFIEITEDYVLDLQSAQHVIDERVKVVSFTLISNVLGTVTPAREVVQLAHKVGALAIVDAAQGVVHQPVDVTALDCDFLAFSGHKLYGPTGVGVLFGKKEHLERFEPFFFGGDMIRYVTYDEAQWADLPNKFEAGTPPIASVVGLGAAVTYVQQLGWEAVQQHESLLTEYALEQLAPHVKIIGPQDPRVRSGVISFIMDGIHPHDIGDILGKQQIAVRVGHHCAMPLMQHLDLTGTTRASFAVYNTSEDVDKLVAGIQEVKKVFA